MWPNRRDSEDPFAEFDGRTPRRRVEADSDAPLPGSETLIPTLLLHSVHAGTHLAYQSYKPRFLFIHTCMHAYIHTYIHIQMQEYINANA